MFAAKTLSSWSVERKGVEYIFVCTTIDDDLESLYIV